MKATIVSAVIGVISAVAFAATSSQGTQSRNLEAAADGTVIWAVGDMCDDDHTPLPDCAHVADLIAGDPELDHFLMLGDGQYETGSFSAYNRYYHPKVGSKLNGVTAPIPGNHEYMTPNASGYFDYFGSRAGDPRRGYYSFTTPGWRLMGVNTACGKVGGCSPTTPQGTWLRAQIGQPEKCELIFGHNPPITDGKYAPGIRAAKNFHNMAFDGGAELLITGHDHNYQRFDPMNKLFESDVARGVLNVVSGAGGEENVPWMHPPRSAYRQNSTFGAVRIVLTSAGYEGEYRALDGTVMDRFSGTCH